MKPINRAVTSLGSITLIDNTGAKNFSYTVTGSMSRSLSWRSYFPKLESDSISECAEYFLQIFRMIKEDVSKDPDLLSHTPVSIKASDLVHEFLSTGGFNYDENGILYSLHDGEPVLRFYSERGFDGIHGHERDVDLGVAEYEHTNRPLLPSKLVSAPDYSLDELADMMKREMTFLYRISGEVNDDLVGYARAISKREAYYKVFGCNPDEESWNHLMVVETSDERRQNEIKELEQMLYAARTVK